MGQLTAMEGAIKEIFFAVGRLVQAVAQLFHDAPLPTVVGLALAIVIWQFLCAPDEASSQSKSADTVKDKASQAALAEGFRRLGAPAEPHEEGAMIPSSEFVLGNSAQISEFHNENCSGKFLALHRATYDKELNKSCKYRYGKYFKGKKRLWEARVQFKFVNPPDPADLFFGIELEAYVPMNAATKGLMGTLVRTLKSAVGNQVYHSPGDDPDKVSGELEKPVFVMPLFAFDQYMVHPEGEDPPELTDENIPFMGSKRVNRVREFKRELEELKFKVGSTYTFCFWGISQWLDKLNWKVKMPLLSPVDFNRFCGRPPVHVVIYTLKDDDSRDPRHLQRRKDYFFNLAFWTSTDRPDAGRVAELLGEAHFTHDDDVVPGNGFGVHAHQNGSSARRKSLRALGGLVACCTSR